jgi:leucyl aminopeptidase
LSKSELKKKGFGGISAVGQGSKNEPKLIIFEYNGKRGEKPTVLVGKAVTFDTGGISIKPADKMDEMKFDKCGGCTVFGIIKAAAELRLPVNLVGIVPSVENMPGGESYRPSDIIKLYSGKTAEVLNTDAEGRLILFDALSYGIKTYKPKEIIDFATLTGACIVALGSNVAGLISNNPRLAEKLKQSSEKTGEEIWQLPLNDDYMDMIKSDYADIKNVGSGRVAGTITAAAFLASAIENTPWAHFDIAGTAWVQGGSKDKSYNPKGATGFGVRLILDYLSSP